VDPEIVDAPPSVGIISGSFKFPLRCGSRRSVRLDEDERKDKNFFVTKVLRSDKQTECYAFAMKLLEMSRQAAPLAN